MKVIVTTWYDIHTQVPYSVERISTSAQNVMEYLKQCETCFGDTIEFAEDFGDFRENKFINGEEYLQQRIDWDTLDKCFARMYHSIFDEDEREYKYFMFQVRNVH